MTIESVMPSNHLILCHPFLLLSSIFPSIRVFSNESGLRIRWPKHWSFNFSISPSNEYSTLISLLFNRLLRVFSSTIIQKHQFFGALLIIDTQNIGSIGKKEIYWFHNSIDTTPGSVSVVDWLCDSGHYFLFETQFSSM